VLGLFEIGVHDGIDLLIKIAESPYVAKELFLEYLGNVVIPSIESNRELPGCQGKRVIIVCENCSCHCSDDILQELANHELILIAYPPHALHLFQVLDVLLFGHLKSAKKYLAGDDNLDSHVDHTFRVFRAYAIATASTTVRSSWEKAGLGSVRRDGTYYLGIGEGRIWASPQFVEVWQVDCPEERLSEGRPQQKWGFLNQGLFRIEVTDMGPRADFTQ
jgi:hypothetical protein